MDDIRILSVDGLDALIQELRERGYTVMGPSVHGDAIVITEIDEASDLPRGVRDRHGPTRHRRALRDDHTVFGFATPAQSTKPALFPADKVICPTPGTLRSSPSSAMPRASDRSTRASRSWILWLRSTTSAPKRRQDLALGHDARRHDRIPYPQLAGEQPVE